MIYSAVKTIEKATELVTTKVNELKLNDGSTYSFFETITVEGAGGEIQAICFRNIKKNISVICAYNDADGNDEAWTADVVIVD